MRRMLPDKNTLGLWRLDESGDGTAYDLGPNARDGTATGTTALAVAGYPFSMARDFNGSSHIAVGDYVDLEPVALTIECWLNPAAWLPGAVEWIVAKGDGSAFGYGLFLDPTNGLTLQIGNGTSVDSVSYNTVPAGMNYLAATYIDPVMSLFVDGVHVASASHAAGGSIGHDDDPLIFGASSALAQNMDAVLAEVRISDRARSQWEIFNVWKAVDRVARGFK